MKTIESCQQCDLSASKQHQLRTIFRKILPSSLTKYIPVHANVNTIESPRCGCAKKPAKMINPQQGRKFKAYFGRLFSLCVICCAAPYVLVAFGLISVSTGAYLGRILEVSLIFGLLMLVSYLVRRHFRSRQTG